MSVSDISTGTDIINSIIQRTNNDLILFAIVILVFLAAAVGVILKFMDASQKSKAEAEQKRQENYINREKEIIDVVNKNSEVISSLKTALEMMGTNNTNAFGRIDTRLDVSISNQMSVKEDIAAMKEALAGVNTKVDTLLRRRIPPQVKLKETKGGSDK